MLKLRLHEKLKFAWLSVQAELDYDSMFLFDFPETPIQYRMYIDFFSNLLI